MSGILFWFVVYLVVMAATLWLFTTLMGASRDDVAPTKTTVRGKERLTAPQEPTAKISRSAV